MKNGASIISLCVLLASCIHSRQEPQQPSDPFAWMQSDKDRLKSWLEKELADTRKNLDAYQNRFKIKDQITETFHSDFSTSDLKIRGSKYFFKIISPNSESPSYALSEDGGRTYSIILDAQTLTSQNATILWAEPDNAGNRIFFGLSKNLEEVGEGKVFDIKSEKFLPDTIQGVSSSTTVTFLPDGKSFLYSSKLCHIRKCPDRKGRHLYLHTLGSQQSDDRVLFGPGLTQSATLEGDEIVGSFFMPEPSQVIAWAYSRKKSSYTFFQKSVGVLERPDLSWKPISTDGLRVTNFDSQGSTISFGLMDDGVKKAKIGLATWTRDHFDFVPIQSLEPEFSLDALVPAQDKIVVLGHKGMTSTIRVIPLKSKTAKDFDAPLDTTYVSIITDSLRKDAIVEEKSYGRQSQFLRFNLDKQSFEPLFPSMPIHEVSDLVVTQEWAKSADGTNVPMTILSREGRGSPTLMSVYGSYGISKRPKWDPKTVSWLKLGGAEVICHVRGGGELGEAWHEGGKRRNRFKSIQDAEACAEKLIRSGFTKREHLALMSGSAGGVVSNNLAVTRPDLFKAVVTRVGLAHLTALHLMPAGAASVPELGDIRDPADRAAMEKIDPYLLIKPGQKLPALFLTIGWNDSRVLPWQPAKFAAKIKSALPLSPVLVRTDFQGGHGLVTFTKSQQLEEWSDIAVFLMHELWE